MNKLEEFFYNSKKIFGVQKGPTYFKAYDNHLKRFIGKNPVMVEIGIDQGGSLEMWNNYFDGECTIIGIDINDPSHIQKKFRDAGINNIHCLKGDQGKPEFWDEFLKVYGSRGIDIILDDGGHKMHQQKLSFYKLIDAISINGLYVCEDLCTSYWPRWGGGKNANWKPLEDTPQSTIMLFKSLIDDLNRYAINNTKNSDCVDQMMDKKYPNIFSLHFYNGMCCIEKEPYRDNKVMWGK